MTMNPSASPGATAPTFIERRSPPRPEAVQAPPWMAAMLDALDYGLLLLDAAHRVAHANRAARTALARDPVGLSWVAALDCQAPEEAAALGQAISAAAERGWRRLVSLRRDGRPFGVAVLPLPTGGHPAVMLVLSRARSCEPLSVHWYARSHGLTQAEARVLEALCGGATPNEVAVTLGVAMSTVRTQLATIRAKTGAAGLRQLVAGVASLPPIVCAVECS
jgi:DNA-binding CsgD family transcriptional regulator